MSYLAATIVGGFHSPGAAPAAALRHPSQREHPEGASVSTINLTVDGQPIDVPEGTTGAAVFAERRDVVVVRVDGQLRDLDRPLPAGAAVEGVTLTEPDGLTVLRHSAAHVMAQAVQQVNPEAKLGIGPPIADGFYYDFDVAQPFTPEDLKDIAKRMARIVKEGQTFRRRPVTDAEARAELADQPYKLELIGLKNHADDAAEGAAVEVGSGELTIYDNLRRDGSTAWKDLCRGPHLPSTKLIGIGFDVLRSAAAYWRGS
jgi:threonyl-tRNA synthetase